MSETYQVVFLKAGDGSPGARQAVAEKLSAKTNTPKDRLLKQLESAPFIYKKGIPKAKAQAIAAALNSLGAVTEIRPDAPARAAAAASPPQAAAPPSGLDLGGAPAGGGASDFSFGAPAAGGFSFGTPGAPAPARPSADFAIETPPPGEVEGAGDGFSFSLDAAVRAPTAPAPVSAVEVQRNEDFTSSAPPPAARAAAKKTETIVCPRCSHEQAPADECVNCGVVLAKAGEAPAPSAPARRRAPVRPAARRSSPLMPVLIVALVAIVGAGGAYLAGVFNPFLIQMAANRDPVLKAAATRLAPPQGKALFAEITDPATVTEVQAGFVDRSRRIAEETARLAALDDLAEFDRQAQVLQGEVEAYTSHPARRILEQVGQVVAPYYTVQGIGLKLPGGRYMYSEAIALSGATDTKALLNADEIRRSLERARGEAQAHQAERLDRERRERVNVSLEDAFTSGPGDRWQVGSGLAMSVEGGRLRLAARPGALAASPMLSLPEPLADYVAEVDVTAAPNDASRGGLVVYQGPGAFVGVVYRAEPPSAVVQAITQAAEGYSAQAGRSARLRIERKGPYYTFFAADPAGNWTQIDRLQPSWDEGVRRIALVAYQGQSSFVFSRFALKVSP